MFPALILGLALAAGSPPPPPQDMSLARLVREACVETNLDRAAFERLARERRWTPQQLSRSTGSQGWNVVYGAGPLRVMLSGLPLEGQVDPATASLCMVSAQRPRGDWRADLAALASDIGLEAEPTPDFPGGADVQIWSKFASLTLTSAYQPANQTVAVTLSRQIVTSTTVDTPPRQP